MIGRRAAVAAGPRAAPPMVRRGAAIQGRTCGGQHAREPRGDVTERRRERIAAGGLKARWIMRR